MFELDGERLASSSAENVLDHYQRALGALIHDFSLLEVFLFRFLCSISGLSIEMGQALFSGSRAEAMISLIRRCYKARDATIEPYFENTLQHISILNSARNDVVHLVTLPVEDNDKEVFMTNGLRYMAHNAKTEMIAPKVLENMAKDARIICAILLAAGGEFEEADSTLPIRERLKSKPLPWSYKPSKSRASSKIARRQH